MPGYQMEPVPFDHEIYHCFYDFDQGAPVCQGQPNPDLGLFYNDRLVCFLTSGDLHCGWIHDVNSSRTGRVIQEAYKMGVNIVIYALTH